MLPTLKSDVRGLQTSVETMRDDMNTMKSDLQPISRYEALYFGSSRQIHRHRIPRRSLGLTRTQHDALNGIFKYQ